MHPGWRATSGRRRDSVTSIQKQAPAVTATPRFISAVGKTFIVIMIITSICEQSSAHADKTRRTRQMDLGSGIFVF